MRKITLLAVAAVITAVGFSISTGTHRVASSKVSRRMQRPVPVATPPRPGIIDGAVTPELIPDDTAYALVFRVVGGRTTPVEKGSVRAYLRQAGLGCQLCTRAPNAGEEAEIDAVIAVADEYWRRVGELDAQTAEIKDRAWPNPSEEDMGRLRRLDAQRKVITAQIVASLPGRLGPAAAKLKHHIDKRVKPAVKIYPEPASLPGGPDWQPSAPPHQHQP